MQQKGDIPSREDVKPDSVEYISPSAVSKVALVDGLLSNGGTAHVYLASHGDDDLHLYDYNTHRFTEQGVIFFHGDDRDKWIPGDSIEMVERHYM